MEEIWKDIPEYEGMYQASTLGRSKSLDKTIFRRNNRSLTFYEKIRKSTLHCNTGYLYISLHNNNKIKIYSVQQLIINTFSNHNNKNNLVIDHVNNIKTDNRLVNLQLITQRENCSKDKKNGSSKYVGVSWHKKSKKWESKIRIKGRLKHLGYFNKELNATKAYQNKLKEIKLSNDERPIKNLD